MQIRSAKDLRVYQKAYALADGNLSCGATRFNWCNKIAPYETVSKNNKRELFNLVNNISQIPALCRR